LIISNYIFCLDFVLTEPKDNLNKILAFIVTKEETSKGQKLNYLNLFTKFCTKIDDSIIDKLGFSLDEIFCW